MPIVRITIFWCTDMAVDWTNIVTAVVAFLTGGGGIWAWLNNREGKRKTPYDMMVDMLEEQRRFYHEKNEEMRLEKLDSAEKSAVIQKSQKCRYKYNDPNIQCPVDVANEERLKNRCDRCGYVDDKEDAK